MVLLGNNENLNLNIDNLYSIKEMEARYSKILIIENPNAFIAIREHLEAIGEEISLVCTGGQVNQCGHLFLEKLKKKWSRSFL